MSIYRKLDTVPEHKTQFPFKGKREHIAIVNMPSMAYPNHHIDTKIPHGSRDHAILSNAVKMTFNLDMESADKTCSIVNNAGSVLVNKKVLMLGSKEIDTINNADIYDTKNLLKACAGAKKADGTALTVTTKENSIKKNFGKRFAMPLGLDFFKDPVYPYGLEDLIVRLELNYPEKLILCS